MKTKVIVYGKHAVAYWSRVGKYYVFEFRQSGQRVLIRPASGSFLVIPYEGIISKDLAKMCIEWLELHPNEIRNRNPLKQLLRRIMVQ
jgi:hypothetical protein